jgi:hypothetical protein
MADIVHIDPAADEDRFARFKLIAWWDQDRLRNARVLVVGAGALGNEIIKNLALLGVGRVFVADRDRIERSNLSRSVLFRDSDCGRAKAEVAAERARELFPEMRLQAFDGNIVYDLGLGIYRWAGWTIARPALRSTRRRRRLASRGSTGRLSVWMAWHASSTRRTDRVTNAQ